MSLSICAQRKWAEAQREADSWCRKYAGLRAAYSVELARLTGQTDKSHSVIDSLASASSRPLNRTHSEAENTFLQSHRPSETQLQISPHHNQSKLRHQTQVEATRRRSVGEALLTNQPVQEENHEDSLSYKTDSLSEQQTDEESPQAILFSSAEAYNEIRNWVLRILTDENGSKQFLIEFRSSYEGQIPLDVQFQVAPVQASQVVLSR
ncbi:unnamed protein product [Protopolystoma xenopodis]|uniref:Uncharacterized protein n=1 Tax=Protopolystoma xenopodis TaxID=117903 RepID=A0A3S4ZNZ2_9PLAT|nr:unnamed protein product [Protopolystoma xenopodis]